MLLGEGQGDRLADYGSIGKRWHVAITTLIISIKCFWHFGTVAPTPVGPLNSTVCECADDFIHCVIRTQVDFSSFSYIKWLR
jgi:hypothetical protein